jgi:hypothetical protein
MKRSLDLIAVARDHQCMTTHSSSSIVLRVAAPADAAALRRLAQLDSKRLPAGDHLVAERDGVMIAALAQPGGVAIADPFTPSADAVELLREWARARAAAAAARPRRRPRLLPARRQIGERRAPTA